MSPNHPAGSKLTYCQLCASGRRKQPGLRSQPVPAQPVPEGNVMTIQPDEDLHVIPNAGAPGTAGGGFRVIDRTDATDEEFRARIARFDAAEEPEEVTVERVARELYRQWREDSGGDPADLPDWERLNEECGDEDESDLRGAYRRRAVLILAATATLAGQHTTDEEADAQAPLDDSETADELATAGLRACCGQPSERHCQ
jgi:hypothetical protein